jgi:hypothetical protein
MPHHRPPATNQGACHNPGRLLQHRVPVATQSACHNTGRLSQPTASITTHGAHHNQRRMRLPQPRSPVKPKGLLQPRAPVATQGARHNPGRVSLTQGAGTASKGMLATIVFAGVLSSLGRNAYKSRFHVRSVSPPPHVGGYTNQNCFCRRRPSIFRSCAGGGLGRGLW